MVPRWRTWFLDGGLGFLDGGVVFGWIAWFLDGGVVYGWMACFLDPGLGSWMEAVVPGRRA